MTSIIQTKKSTIHKETIQPKKKVLDTQTYSDITQPQATILNQKPDPSFLKEASLKRLKSYEQGIQALLENFKRNGISDDMIRQLNIKIKAYFNTAQEEIDTLTKDKEYSVSKYKTIIQIVLLEVKKLLKENTKLPKITALIHHFERLAVQKQKSSEVHTVLHLKKDLPATTDQENSPIIEIHLEANSVNQTNIGLKKEWERIETSSVPAWFSNLPFLVQKKYQHVLQTSQDKNNTLSELLNNKSSSSRDAPALSNVKSHSVEVATKEGKQALLKSISYSIVVPINVSHKPSQFWLTLLNLSQVIQLAIQEKKSSLSFEKPLPILLQTLVSPGPISSLFNRETHYYQLKQKVIALFEYGLEHPNESIEDEFLKSQIKAHGAEISPITYRTLFDVLGFHLEKAGILAAEGKSFKIELFATNHPVNFLGRVNRLWYKLAPFSKAKHENDNKKTQARFIEKVEEFLNKNPNSEAFVSELLKAYKSTLKFPAYRGRNKALHLASLEEILIYSIGGVSTGSCKSGKDRFGIKTMYSQALVLYWYCYGEMLNYHDSNQAFMQFNEILVALYRSGHHQRCAECNAPGSYGIKTPGDILPRCTCDRIETLERGRLSLDHQLAGFNKISLPKFLKKYWIMLKDTLNSLFSTKIKPKEVPLSVHDETIYHQTPLLHSKFLKIRESQNLLNLKATKNDVVEESLTHINELTDHHSAPEVTGYKTPSPI